MLSFLRLAPVVADPQGNSPAAWPGVIPPLMSFFAAETLYQGSGGRPGILPRFLAAALPVTLDTPTLGPYIGHTLAILWDGVLV